MKECFIIMPITTPDSRLLDYGKDKEHFNHVLNYLFKPVIEEMGMKPVEPTVKGSELIHGEIIKNIEKADMVLCDISILNPNVFFELGIRTAVNKPVCIVKDDITKDIPFDTNSINTFTYGSALKPWDLEKDKPKLLDHLKSTSQKNNALWKYFSLTVKAEPVEAAEGVQAELERLSLKIDNIRFQGEKDLGEMQSLSGQSILSKEQLSTGIFNLLEAYKVHDFHLIEDSRGIDIIIDKGIKLSDILLHRLFNLGRAGINIRINGDPLFGTSFIN